MLGPRPSSAFSCSDTCLRTLPAWETKTFQYPNARTRTPPFVYSGFGLSGMDLNQQAISFQFYWPGCCKWDIYFGKNIDVHVALSLALHFLSDDCKQRIKHSESVIQRALGEGVKEYQIAVVESWLNHRLVEMAPKILVGCGDEKAERLPDFLELLACNIGRRRQACRFMLSRDAKTAISNGNGGQKNKTKKPTGTCKVNPARGGVMHLKKNKRKKNPPSVQHNLTTPPPIPYRRDCPNSSCRPRRCCLRRGVSPAWCHLPCSVQRRWRKPRPTACTPPASASA